MYIYIYIHTYIYVYNSMCIYIYIHIQRISHVDDVSDLGTKNERLPGVSTPARGSSQPSSPTCALAPPFAPPLDLRVSYRSCSVWPRQMLAFRDGMGEGVKAKDATMGSQRKDQGFEWIWRIWLPRHTVAWICLEKPRECHPHIQFPQMIFQDESIQKIPRGFPTRVLNRRCNFHPVEFTTGWFDLYNRCATYRIWWEMIGDRIIRQAQAIQSMSLHGCGIWGTF